MDYCEGGASAPDRRRQQFISIFYIRADNLGLEGLRESGGEEEDLFSLSKLKMKKKTISLLTGNQTWGTISLYAEVNQWELAGDQECPDPLPGLHGSTAAEDVSDI